MHQDNYGAYNLSVGNGYYEVINLTGMRAQYSAWIPSGNNHDLLSGFTCENNAVGFISFRLNTYSSSQGFDMKIVAGRGTADWNWGTCAATIFRVNQVKSFEQTTTDIYGINNTLIKTVELGEDKFTGWMDVVIGIELNDDLTIEVTYYIDGELLATYNGVMPIIVNKIQSVYINGRTDVVDSGYMLADFVVGYTPDGTWGDSEPSDHEHEWTEATCTDPMTCTVCGRTKGSALGHSANPATCTEDSVCMVCGIVVEAAFGHSFMFATCTDPETCGRCGITVGEPLGHTFDDNHICVNCGLISEDHVHIDSDSNLVCDFCGSVKYPEADSHITIEQAIALGLAAEHNCYSPDKYYVTGVITEIANVRYGNLYISDEFGNTIYIYGTYSADGSARFDAMETQPVVGDTVTLYGIIGQYKDQAQMKNAWVAVHISLENGDPETILPDSPSIDAGGSGSNSWAGAY